MDIVFDGALEAAAFHDPGTGAVHVVTRGAGAGGFGAELEGDALLAVDEDDAFVELYLPTPRSAGLDRAAEADLAAARAEALDLPEAELAEADFDEARPLRWALEGDTLVVVVPGRTRSMWARIGGSGLAVALDLEREGEAHVAALLMTPVQEDPGLTQLEGD